MRDGIQPSDVTGQAGLLATMKSRPGHVYFMTDPTPAARFAAGVVNEPQVRVDIRRLDLARLATDEDRVGAERQLSQHRHVVKQLPGWGRLPERPDHVSVGDWMNQHSSIVDAPAWVLHSMAELTVAYRGGVPPALLEFLPLYLTQDWEPAAPGEAYEKRGPGQPAQYYIGLPEAQP